MRRRSRQVPWQQLGEPVDRMGADTRDHVGEVGLGLDAVEPARADERVECGGTGSACIGPAEQPVFFCPKPLA
jgi:hypothetical protein